MCHNMRHDYLHLIKETAGELQHHERQHRRTLAGTRLRMLILLKTGQASSVQAAAKLLGCSWRQCQRWLSQYCSEGLPSLLTIKPRGGSTERMTPEAWAALDKAMRQGAIGSYEQARVFLAGQGVVYQDNTSILRLFRRHKIKARPDGTGTRKQMLNSRKPSKKLL